MDFPFSVSMGTLKNICIGALDVDHVIGARLISNEAAGVRHHRDRAGVVEHRGDERVDETEQPGDHADAIEGEGESVVLADDANGFAAEPDRPGQVAEIVGSESETGGVDGDVRASGGHGYPEVGGGE